MTAAVYLREKNGASEVPSVLCKSGDVAGKIRFKSIDRQNAYDDNGPLVKPVSGRTRSIEKWLRLYMGTPGPAGNVSSPKIYTDGVNNMGTGVYLYVRTTNPGSFSTPSVPADDSAGTNLFSYTSASPKAIDVANAGPFSSTNTDFADYIVLWLSIDTTIVPPGKVLNKMLSIKFLQIVWTET